MGIGERLRQFRQQAALTQKQLEERSGVPQNTISRIEIGSVQEMSTKTLIGLARALHVSTDTLLGMDEPVQGDGEEQARPGNPAPAVSPTPDVSPAATAAAGRKTAKTVSTRRAQPRSMRRKGDGQALD